MAMLRIEFEYVEDAAQSLKEALRELSEVGDGLAAVRRSLALDEVTFCAVQEELAAAQREIEELEHSGRRLHQLMRRAAQRYRTLETQLYHGGPI